MSVKKLALLGLASVAALGMSVSLAGGPAHHHRNHHDSGLFVGLDLGARYNTTLDKTVAEWDLVDDDTGTSFTSKKAPWGFSFGGLVGYQVDNHWAVEFGYDHDQDQKADYGNAGLDHYTFKSHSLTFAVKRSFHMDHDFDGYMVIGAAHTNQDLKEVHLSDDSDAADLKKDFWSPMGAFGISYELDHNCGLNFQYTYVMGSSSTDITTVEHAVMGASTQRLTVGVDYMFNM